MNLNLRLLVRRKFGAEFVKTIFVVAVFLLVRLWVEVLGNTSRCNIMILLRSRMSHHRAAAFIPRDALFETVSREQRVHLIFGF